jgi:hypothetical protein
MSESFVRFMVSPAGRALRVGAGLGMLAWGLPRRDATAGAATAALALVPLGAGLLDQCVLGPVFGYPLEGDAARRAVS